MRALLLAFLSLPVSLSAQVCTVEPPPGTGLLAGKGWVHCMKPGIYTLHGAAINGKKVTWCGVDPTNGVTGRFAPIEQIASRAEWTRPDGVREQIPVTALYPPMK